ncbi:hypothetical protein K2P97_06020 [bacterium]|nr:hypothetical protein [bacterium]
MGFLRLIGFFLFLIFSLQSNSDILRKGTSGPFILPGGSTTSAQPKRTPPVQYTKPREPSSEVNQVQVTTSQKISEDEKLEPRAVYMGGNGQVRSSGGGSMISFLNLTIEHSYSDKMPDDGTYHVGWASYWGGSGGTARKRLDYSLEVESIDPPEGKIRRVVFYNTKGYNPVIEFVAIFDREDLYNSKLYYCSKVITSMLEHCDKKEITVKSKDLFGNVSKLLMGPPENPSLKIDMLIWRLFNNGRSLLGLR